MYKNITAAILSGGKSRRMGSNKSLMELKDKTVIRHIYDIISPLFEKVILITNEPENYNFLEIEKFQDINPGYGPISGIHTALVRSNAQKVFVISCDIPLINADAIKYIIEYPSQNTIVVPKAEGYVQQLCGIYSKSLTEKIEADFFSDKTEDEGTPSCKKGKCRVLRLVEETGGKIIDFESGYPYYHSDLFFNMNKPEDFEYVKSRLL